MESIEAEREIETEIEKEELRSTIAEKDKAGQKNILIINLVQDVPIKLEFKGNYKYLILPKCGLSFLHHTK